MKNKTILVFGASRGIGRVFAQEEVEKGNDVYVFARSWEKRAEIEPTFIEMDFCEESSVRKTLFEFLRSIKKVDAIVFSQRYRGDQDSWQAELDTTVNLFKYVIENSLEHLNKDASIVAISSNAAKNVALEQPVSYHASKAALEQMIRYYAVKLAKNGIRVNGVSPAITLKPENKNFYNNEKILQSMFSKAIPLGRMCESKDVCHAIDFLLSEKAAFITGQILTVDGGLSLMTPEVLLRDNF